MRPPCLYHWASEGDVVNTLVVVPLLPFVLKSTLDPPVIMCMTPRYGCSAKTSCFGAWGDYGGVDLGDAEAEVEELALPDGAGTRGWVDAGRARCCKVVVGGGMCVR
jgi:hypothetical protein